MTTSTSGLVTMRERAEQVGGGLRIESVPGAGTTVHAVAGLTQRMAVANRPIRVLCVDDHRLMREGVAKIVGVQPDMEVVAEASNGEHAVAQFLASRPDVTVMDVQLPVMSGPEATRRIRRTRSVRADHHVDDVPRRRGHPSRVRSRGDGLRAEGHRSPTI